jgi:hypothetical protein
MTVLNVLPNLSTHRHKRMINFCFYSKTNEMHNISNIFYFGKNTLRVSDGLSVHHQKSKTVHTASGVCHRGCVAAC